MPPYRVLIIIYTDIVFLTFLVMPPTPMVVHYVSQYCLPTQHVASLHPSMGQSFVIASAFNVPAPQVCVLHLTAVGVGFI